MNISNIAECIRKVRIQQNMTLEQLAVKSGFTKGYVSKLENFRVTPSISALNKISAVLGVPVTAFFENDLKSPLYLKSNLSEGEEIDRDEGTKYGIRYFSQAFRKIDRIIDPFIIEYTPSDKIRDMNMHDADEFYVLLEGGINFYIGDMSNSVSLKPNDTLYLSANLPHTAELASGCKFAKAMVIYCAAQNKKG
jgi:transcriptional regulator with XRE-family HTH domain